MKELHMTMPQLINACSEGMAKSTKLEVCYRWLTHYMQTQFYYIYTLETISTIISRGRFLVVQINNGTT